MKLKSIPLAFLACLAGIFLFAERPLAADTSPEYSAGDLSVSVRTVDPVCHPENSATFHTVLELQEGLFAWIKIGEWEFCVNNGGTSEITVYDHRNSYRTQILVNGRHVNLAPPADNGWLLVFTRQDYLHDKPSDSVLEKSLVLNPGNRGSVRLDGLFSNQTRNLRIVLEQRTEQ